MLKNAYLLAKIGADTAENERNFAENLPKIGNYPTGPHVSAATRAARTSRAASTPRSSAAATSPKYQRCRSWNARCEKA